MINKICKYCHNVFQSRPDRGIFCSRDCRGLFERKQTEIVCQICKKVFIAVPTKTKKLCSWACLGRYNHFKALDIPRPRPNWKGHNVHNWKGNKVKYRALHSWVQRWKGKPDTCEHCGKSGLKGKSIHWANKSKEYIRNLEDWVRLCGKCHKAFDKI